MTAIVETEVIRNVVVENTVTNVVTVSSPGATGAAGSDGADGTNGVGVPVGGTTGQVLAKIDATDNNTNWVDQSGGGGSGDVVGPASSTDTAIAIYDDATGKLIKGSGVLIDDSDNITGVNDITIGGVITGDGSGLTGLASTNEFLDSVFKVNNSVDPTKQLALDNSSITTGTVRTITSPDFDFDFNSYFDVNGSFTVNTLDILDDDYLIRIQENSVDKFYVKARNGAYISMGVSRNMILARDGLVGIMIGYSVVRPRIHFGSEGSIDFNPNTIISGLPDTSLKRDSPGVLKITDGSTGLGVLLALKQVTRVTVSTTLTSKDSQCNANTDTAGITITLPAGIQGTEYKIVNTGTSSNQVTITPDGTEKLIGVNSSFTINDGESLTVAYDITDGWF